MRQVCSRAAFLWAMAGDNLNCGYICNILYIIKSPKEKEPLNYRYIFKQYSIKREMKRDAVLLAIFLAVFAQFASAAYDYKNQSMQANYRAGDTINGSITIKFVNESAY